MPLCPLSPHGSLDVIRGMGAGAQECLRICSSSICYFRSKVSLDSSSIEGEMVILEKDMLKHVCGKKKVGWLGNFPSVDSW